MHVLSRRFLGFALTTCLLSWALSASAVSYRWKDKEGKIHYGSVVPAEYADQPYDILNEDGLLIKRVESTREPPPVITGELAKDKLATREPLISESQRRQQADNLLLVQYSSEADIQKQLDFEITQLGYDARILQQSYDNVKTALRDNIRQAADQQRAGMQVSEEQKAQINQLGKRLELDRQRIAALDKKEAGIRERLMADLKRYRELSGTLEDDGNRSGQDDQVEGADQG